MSRHSPTVLGSVSSRNRSICSWVPTWTVRMGVEHQAHVELVGEDPAELGHAGGQGTPLIRFEAAGLEYVTTVHVGVLLRQ